MKVYCAASYPLKDSSFGKDISSDRSKQIICHDEDSTINKIHILNVSLYFIAVCRKPEQLSEPTTFSGQLTRGTLSWYSAGGGTVVVSGGCCCVGFGLSLAATAAVDSGTVAPAADAAPEGAAGATT